MKKYKIPKDLEIRVGDKVLKYGKDEIATKLGKWLGRPVWLNYLLLWIDKIFKKLRKEFRL